MRSRKNKAGNILTENVIFLVLNIAYITILLLFLFTRTGEAPVLEEKYAKQIALMIDASEPIMTVSVNMEDAIKLAQKNDFPLDEIVTINDNVVTVKLYGESYGSSYSFFNDVEAHANLDTVNKKSYYLTINKK